MLFLKSGKTALKLTVFFRAEKPCYHPGPIREMRSHDEVKFLFFHEVREILFYFSFYGCRFLFLSYNVPYGFIEFPVEQDYFMPPAGLFYLTHEEKLYLDRHSGGFFPFFQKISYEVKILLPVINFSAVNLYL